MEAEQEVWEGAVTVEFYEGVDLPESNRVLHLHQLAGIPHCFDTSVPFLEMNHHLKEVQTLLASDDDTAQEVVDQ